MPTTSNMSYNHPLIVSDDTNYQGFNYNIETKKCEPTNHRTIGKWKTLGSYFEDGLVKGKSFADIGANFGFFNFKALENGCTKTVAIESSKDYAKELKKCLNKSKIENFDLIVGKYPKDVKELKVDVLMAMSILHHLYSKNKLEECVKEILSRTKKNLIIEWIDVDDRSMKRKKHNLNKDYTKSNFERILSEQCKSVKQIGEGHHDTRMIYLASK